MTQMLHVWVIYGANVGKYTSTMEHLGDDDVSFLWPSKYLGKWGGRPNVFFSTFHRYLKGVLSKYIYICMYMRVSINVGSPMSFIVYNGKSIYRWMTGGTPMTSETYLYVSKISLLCFNAEQITASLAALFSIDLSHRSRWPGSVSRNQAKPRDHRVGMWNWH